MFKIPTIPTIVGQMDTVHNDKYKWCAGGNVGVWGKRDFRSLI